MRKREMAATVLGSRVAAAMYPVLYGAYAGGHNALRILAYHRIQDAGPEAFPFDEGVISATTESFRKQMAFAAANFDVVSFGDLSRIERDSDPWPKRAVVVTFDDGYRDNYTAAFPILKSIGLPATIFVATGHVGHQKLFWWDLIAYAVKHSALKSISFTEISADPMPLGDSTANRVAIETILRWIKRVPQEIKEQFLADLPSRLSVTVPVDIAKGMHLSWDDVREMAASRIEFGAHTVTHPVLVNTPEAQIEDEIRSSKEAIERETGKPVISFAYPVGGRANFTACAENAVQTCGYQFALSYDEGYAHRASNRFTLPRIHVELDQTFAEFRASLMFPGLMLGAAAM